MAWHAVQLPGAVDMDMHVNFSYLYFEPMDIAHINMFLLLIAGLSFSYLLLIAILLIATLLIAI